MAIYEIVRQCDENGVQVAGVDVDVANERIRAIREFNLHPTRNLIITFRKAGVGIVTRTVPPGINRTHTFPSLTRNRLIFRLVPEAGGEEGFDFDWGDVQLETWWG